MPDPDLHLAALSSVLTPCSKYSWKQGTRNVSMLRLCQGQYVFQWFGRWPPPEYSQPRTFSARPLLRQFSCLRYRRDRARRDQGCEAPAPPFPHMSSLDNTDSQGHRISKSSSLIRKQKGLPAT
ncbi:hypothetical protein AB1N83_007331 [Pleurotus pulmonarius]